MQHSPQPEPGRRHATFPLQINFLPFPPDIDPVPPLPLHQPSALVAARRRRIPATYAPCRHGPYRLRQMHRLLLAWTWTRRGIIDPSLMKGNRHPPQFRRFLQLMGDDIQTAILDHPFVHGFRLTPLTPLRPTFPPTLPTL
jgi:hypothetical protein